MIELICKLLIVKMLEGENGIIPSLPSNFIYLTLVIEVLLMYQNVYLMIVSVFVSD